MFRSPLLPPDAVGQMISKEVASVMSVRTLGIAVIVLRAITPLIAQPQSALEPEQLLSLGRGAIDGKGKLGLVKSLYISGTYSKPGAVIKLGFGKRPDTPEAEVGKLALTIALPAQFLEEKAAIRSNGLPGFTTRICVSGDTVWSTVRPPANLPEGVKMSAPDGLLTDDERNAWQSTARRYLLGLLLYIPPALRRDLTYAPVISAGGTDVVAINSGEPQSPPVKLLFDKATHLLRDVVYAEATAPKAPVLSKVWRLDDYRDEHGILLPHRLTVTAGGTLVEEQRFDAFVINSTIAEGAFLKR
jgi:hypothetical protein